MAPRLSPQHDERTRAKIQTSQLINRLQSFVKGEVELSAAQVSAALGLIKKTLPDLASVALTGEGGGPVKYEQVKNDADDFDRRMAVLAARSGTPSAPSDTQH